MSNKFLGYIFIAIVLVLVSSLYVQSVGINKTLSRYAKVALKLRSKQKLQECKLTPISHETHGTGVQIKWDRNIKADSSEEKAFFESQLSYQLALRAMVLVDPSPEFAYVIGPTQKIIIKSSQNPTFIADFFTFNPKSE